MKVTIEKMKEYLLSEFQVIAQWENQEDVRPYLMPRRTEAPLPYVSPEEMMQAVEAFVTKSMYKIYAEGNFVGILSVVDGFELLKSREENVAWMSICIGNKSYWGKGIAAKAMILLEEECRRIGFDFMELGVFEFNKRAFNFYEKMGYEKFSESPHFVYFEDEWYSDIRMIKDLRK